MAAAEGNLEQQKQEIKIYRKQAAKFTKQKKRISQKRNHLPHFVNTENDSEDFTFINKLQIAIYSNLGSKNLMYQTFNRRK